MALTRLSIEVPESVAEEVGQLLVELGAGGVEEQASDGSARLIVYGTEPAELLALAENARDLLSRVGLDEASGTLAVRLDDAWSSDWETAWTRYLKPQILTPLWVVQPIFDPTPPPPGLGRIWIRPTLAFGDGAHVTTRLAAEAVVGFCGLLPSSSVLDIGTGSGVLAFVAALSGARPVLGVDVDPVALSAARANAELNQLASAVSFQDASEERGSNFDLVIANLEPRALIQNAESIAKSAEHARELVLTGFLSEQASEIAMVFSRLGFDEREQRERDGFSLLVLARPRVA